MDTNPYYEFVPNTVFFATKHNYAHECDDPLPGVSLHLPLLGLGTALDSSSRMPCGHETWCPALMREGGEQSCPQSTHGPGCLRYDPTSGERHSLIIHTAAHQFY